MIEILLVFFQSISSGLVEYEFEHFFTQHFADPYFANGVMVSGYVLTGTIMSMLRNTHRVKSIQMMVAACMLTTCLWHTIVQDDKGNQCSEEHHFCEKQYHWFTAIIGSAAVGFGSSLQ
ncbi:hypothetical protein PFISCL1PPCAC_11822, partial [Pristionchus fissidentatus]